MKKTIWTLNIDNYAPEITALTYPLMRHYARKIGADFQVIAERKFPEWPVVYEKLQIYELGRGNDWNIFIDSDALVSPNMFDPTNHMSKDTVAHNGNDMAGNRWRYDQFFRRDGRHIGSCNWFAIASDWCIDLWRPLDDLSLEEAIANIFPLVEELTPWMYCLDNQGQRIVKNGQFLRVAKEAISPGHLIDDYTLSRNIAKYGLKFTTIMDIQKKGGDQGNYLWHIYTQQVSEKLHQMKQVMQNWGIDNFAQERGL